MFSAMSRRQRVQPRTSRKPMIADRDPGGAEDIPAARQVTEAPSRTRAGIGGWLSVFSLIGVALIPTPISSKCGLPAPTASWFSGTIETAW
jgi:hypothetical protein